MHDKVLEQLVQWAEHEASVRAVLFTSDDRSMRARRSQSVSLGVTCGSFGHVLAILDPQGKQ